MGIAFALHKSRCKQFFHPSAPAPNNEECVPVLRVHRGRTWPSDKKKEKKDSPRAHTKKDGEGGGGGGWTAEVVRASLGLIKSGGDRGRVGCLPACLPWCYF